MTRRQLGRGLRACLGLGLLGLLMWRLDLGQVAATLRRPNSNWLAVALVAQIAIKGLWALRWRAILASVGLDRRFPELLALVLAGHFLNYFLPTSAGGDLLRGYYAATTRGSRLDSYAVVVVERFLGLLALFSIVAVATTIGLATGEPLAGSLLWTLLLLSMAGFGAGLLLLSTDLSRVEPRGPISQFSSRVLLALRLFRRAGEGATRQKLLIAGSSLGLQLLGLLFQLACARAMGVSAPTVTVLLVAAAALVAGMIPITLNGLGVREGTLVALLMTTGETAAAAGAFALLSRLIAAGFAGLGGLVLPFLPRPAQHELEPAPTTSADG